MRAATFAAVGLMSLCRSTASGEGSGSEPLYLDGSGYGGGGDRSLQERRRENNIVGPDGTPRRKQRQKQPEEEEVHQLRPAGRVGRKHTKKQRQRQKKREEATVWLEVEKSRRMKRRRCRRQGANKWYEIEECIEKCEWGEIKNCIKKGRKRWRKKRAKKCREMGATGRTEIEECIEKRQWEEPGSQPPRPEIVVYDEEIEVFDAFVCEMQPFCGDNEDGTLSDVAKARLEKAMAEFFNDEFGCDPRTDEAITDVTITDFVGGEECFDNVYNDGNGAATDQQDVEQRLRRAMMRGLQQQMQDQRDQELQQEQERDNEDVENGVGEEKPSPRKTKETGRKTALRASRSYKCRKCRKKDGNDELAPDSGRRMLLHAIREHGGDLYDDNGSDATISPLLHQRQKLPQQQQEACEANLVSSIQAQGFPDVTYAVILAVRPLDCSVGSDTCNAVDSGCCGAPTCLCPGDDQVEGASCADQEYAFPNDDLSYTFSEHTSLFIKGMCGDGPDGTMSEKMKLGVEAYLLEYANSKLLEDGCGGEVEATNVTIIDFIEEESCVNTTDVATSGEKDEDTSILKVIFEGTCGAEFCIYDFPA